MIQDLKSHSTGQHLWEWQTSSPRRVQRTAWEKPSQLVWNKLLLKYDSIILLCALCLTHSLAHICVDESNVLRLEIHTQIGEQSSMVFLRGHSWDHLYLIYLLMISLTLLFMLTWGYKLCWWYNSILIKPQSQYARIDLQNTFDMLHSWFEYNYLSVNEAKTKVLSLGDNPTHIQLFADRTKPPLDVVKELKLLGLTIDSPLTYKVHVKSVCY